MTVNAAIAGEGPPPPPDLTDPVSEFFRDAGISIRRSAKDKNALPDPATAQFTAPRKGENSYGIDAGITWEVSQYLENSPEDWEFGLFSEYHKNNQSTSQKENFKAGALLLYNYRDIVVDPFAAIAALRANYRDDKVSTGNGYEVALDLTPVIKRPPGSEYYVPNIGGHFGWTNYAEFLIQPVFSIQYVGGEDIMKTKNHGETFQGGTVIQTAFFPFPWPLKRRLEFSGRFGFWQRFGQSGEYRNVDDGDNYIRLGMTYHLGTLQPKEGEERTTPFSIGVDYLKGDDPVEGFRREDTWILALKLKY